MSNATNTSNEALLKQLREQIVSERKALEVMKVQLKATGDMIKSLEKAAQETKDLLGDKTPETK